MFVMNTVQGSNECGSFPLSADPHWVLKPQIVLSPIYTLFSSYTYL